MVFNIPLPTLIKTLYNNAVKFPNFPDFGAHHERCKETLNKLRQSIRRVRSNRNMKDVLLLHDNARPHTNLRTSEAIAKMVWTVLTYARCPDLAPSDFRLFCPVKDARRGRHFADDNELK
jgi:hypothetical protein